MKRAIISLATERGNYYKGLTRLAESLRGNFSGDFLGFMGEASVGAPKHSEVPYGFKVYAHKLVMDMGYNQVIWLDSSVYAIKPVDHLFDLFNDQAVIMQEAGCFVGQWCNDYTLDYFDLTRDEAMKMPCYGNAGFLGFDWTKHSAVSFFDAWTDSMRFGCFNGSWSDHRHDLTCGSIIANHLGFNYQPGNEILQYAAPTDTPNNETICLFAQGL